MDLLDLLDRLDLEGVTLSVAGGELEALGPRQAIRNLSDGIREHRDLLAAHVLGTRTGHVLAFCTECGAPTMTATKAKAWPRCRMTPRCGGANQHGTPKARHVPRQTDLTTRLDAPNPPRRPRPPAKAPKARLLGPWPPMPPITNTNRKSNQ